MTGRLCAHGRSTLGDCALCVAGNPEHGPVTLWTAEYSSPHDIDVTIFIGVFSTRERAEAQQCKAQEAWGGESDIGFEVREITLDKPVPE